MRDEITDFGPWRMVVTNSDVTLYSDDFTHDAAITISGDFADPKQRIAYAESIMRRLSKPSPEVKALSTIVFRRLDDYQNGIIATFLGPWDVILTDTAGNTYERSQPQSRRPNVEPMPRATGPNAFQEARDSLDTPFPGEGTGSNAAKESKQGGKDAVE